MDIIQLLPDSVANQIAAGEVIQRPASVIKELVENAIDAGARCIKVLVVDAGRTSIQVIDDGYGMSDTDARLSFERHATSKIRQASDLFALHTMGFRGEALASIAAVAQVTLQTRRKEDEIGTCVKISGSKVLSQEPVACAVGSNFLIENLFFNVPARRKFLKSNSTEMSNITQCFERMVLVYPNISFILYNNGQEVLHLSATSLRQRILDVFGNRLNQALLPLDTKTTVCNISGFVGKPESAKKKGAKQFFFVNGRYMKHPYFHKAVQMSFERLVPNGEQVPYFIYFTVNPEEIDVNIHPVKTEIKFENERTVWEILMASIRDAVGKFSGVTAIDFDTEGRPDIPVFNQNGTGNIAQPTIEIDKTYNPFVETPNEPQYLPDNKQHSKGSSLPSSSLGLSGKKSCNSGLSGISGTPGISGVANPTATDISAQFRLFDDIISQSNVSVHTPVAEGNLFASAMNDEEEDETASALGNRSHEHYQYHGSYIMTQTDTGLMITDQHRADVRILFEQYMHNLAQKTSGTQRILFPEIVQFPPSYSTSLNSILNEMGSLGFEITDLGGMSYSINGVPAGLAGLDPVTLVNELVSAAVEYGSNVSDEINSILALELAQRAATPYGEVLSQEQMESLIERLLMCDNYRYTPDGKTIIKLNENKDIEAGF